MRVAVCLTPLRIAQKQNSINMILWVHVYKSWFRLSHPWYFWSHAMLLVTMCVANKRQRRHWLNNVTSEKHPNEIKTDKSILVRSILVALKSKWNPNKLKMSRSSTHDRRTLTLSTSLRDAPMQKFENFVNRLTLHSTITHSSDDALARPLNYSKNSLHLANM